MTVQGEEELLAELQGSDTVTPEEIAQQQEKVGKVKTARKRQGDGGEFTFPY